MVSANNIVFVLNLLRKYKRNHNCNHISQMFEDNVFFFTVTPVEGTKQKMPV